MTEDEIVEVMARAISPEAFEGTPEYVVGMRRLARAIKQKVAHEKATRAIEALHQAGYKITKGEV